MEDSLWEIPSVDDIVRYIRNAILAGIGRWLYNKCTGDTNDTSNLPDVVPVRPQDEENTRTIAELDRMLQRMQQTLRLMCNAEFANTATDSAPALALVPAATDTATAPALVPPTREYELIMAMAADGDNPMVHGFIRMYMSGAVVEAAVLAVARARGPAELARAEAHLAEMQVYHAETVREVSEIMDQ